MATARSATPTSAKTAAHNHISQGAKHKNNGLHGYGADELTDETFEAAPLDYLRH